MLAGVGAGIFRGVVEAADEMTAITERYTPNKENYRTYSLLFNLYKRAYHVLSKDNVFRELFQITS